MTAKQGQIENQKNRIAKLERKLLEMKALLSAQSRECLAQYTVAETARQTNDQLSDICNNQLAELRALREECAKLRLGEQQ